MELKDYKILPGTVIDASDPKYLGRVKADSPGLFDSSVMTKEGMPWIYPLNMGGYQRFSKLTLGAKIWILTDAESREFWYWPMFELHESTRDIISGDESNYEEAEVLLARNMGTNGVYIYYTPNDGIVIKQGENTSITLSPDNKIIAKAAERQVLIDNDAVYIGDSEKGSMEPAIMGKKLINYLNSFKRAMDAVATAADSGYTINIAPFLREAAKSLSKPEDLLAKNTKID